MDNLGGQSGFENFSQHLSLSSDKQHYKKGVQLITCLRESASFVGGRIEADLIDPKPIIEALKNYQGGGFIKVTLVKLEDGREVAFHFKANKRAQLLKVLEHPNLHSRLNNKILSQVASVINVGLALEGDKLGGKDTATFAITNHANQQSKSAAKLNGDVFKVIDSSTLKKGYQGKVTSCWQTAGKVNQIAKNIFDNSSFNKGFTDKDFILTYKLEDMNASSDSMSLSNNHLNEDSMMNIAPNIEYSNRGGDDEILPIDSPPSLISSPSQQGNVVKPSKKANLEQKSMENVNNLKQAVTDAEAAINDLEEALKDVKEAHKMATSVLKNAVKNAKTDELVVPEDAEQVKAAFDKLNEALGGVKQAETKVSLAKKLVQKIDFNAVDNGTLEMLEESLSNKVNGVVKQVKNIKNDTEALLKKAGAVKQVQSLKIRAKKQLNLALKASGNVLEKTLSDFTKPDENLINEATEAIKQVNENFNQANLEASEHLELQDVLSQLKGISLETTIVSNRLKSAETSYKKHVEAKNIVKSAHQEVDQAVIFARKALNEVLEQVTGGEELSDTHIIQAKSAVFMANEAVRKANKADAQDLKLKKEVVALTDSANKTTQALAKIMAAASISSIKASVDAAAKKADDLSQQVAKDAKESEEPLEGTAYLVKELNQKATEAASQLNEIIKGVPELEDTFNNIQQSLQSLKTTSMQVEAAKIAQYARIGIQKKVDEIKTEMNSTVQEFINISKKPESRLQLRLEIVSNQVSEAINKVKSAVEVDENLNGVLASIKEAEREVESLSKQLSAVMSMHEAKVQVTDAVNNANNALQDAMSQVSSTKNILNLDLLKQVKLAANKAETALNGVILAEETGKGLDGPFNKIKALQEDATLALTQMNATVKMHKAKAKAQDAVKVAKQVVQGTLKQALSNDKTELKLDFQEEVDLALENVNAAVLEANSAVENHSGLNTLANELKELQREVIKASKQMKATVEVSRLRIKVQDAESLVDPIKKKEFNSELLNKYGELRNQASEIAKKALEQAEKYFEDAPSELNDLIEKTKNAVQELEIQRILSNPPLPMSMMSNNKGDVEDDLGIENESNISPELRNPINPRFLNSSATTSSDILDEEPESDVISPSSEDIENVEEKPLESMSKPNKEENLSALLPTFSSDSAPPPSILMGSDEEEDEINVEDDLDDDLDLDDEFGVGFVGEASSNSPSNIEDDINELDLEEDGDESSFKKDAAVVLTAVLQEQQPLDAKLLKTNPMGLVTKLGSRNEVVTKKNREEVFKAFTDFGNSPSGFFTDKIKAYISCPGLYTNEDGEIDHSQFFDFMEQKAKVSNLEALKEISLACKGNSLEDKTLILEYFNTFLSKGNPEEELYRLISEGGGVKLFAELIEVLPPATTLSKEFHDVISNTIDQLLSKAEAKSLSDYGKVVSRFLNHNKGGLASHVQAKRDQIIKVFDSKVETFEDFGTLLAAFQGSVISTWERDDQLNQFLIDGFKMLATKNPVTVFPQDAERITKWAKKYLLDGNLINQDDYELVSTILMIAYSSDEGVARLNKEGGREKLLAVLDENQQAADQLIGFLKSKLGEPNLSDDEAFATYLATPELFKQRYPKVSDRCKALPKLMDSLGKNNRAKANLLQSLEKGIPENINKETFEFISELVIQKNKLLIEGPTLKNPLPGMTQTIEKILGDAEEIEGNLSQLLDAFSSGKDRDVFLLGELVFVFQSISEQNAHDKRLKILRTGIAENFSPPGSPEEFLELQDQYEQQYDNSLRDLMAAQYIEKENKITKEELSIMMLDKKKEQLGDPLEGPSGYGVDKDKRTLELYLHPLLKEQRDVLIDLKDLSTQNLNDNNVFAGGPCIAYKRIIRIRAEKVSANSENEKSSNVKNSKEACTNFLAKRLHSGEIIPKTEVEKLDYLATCCALDVPLPKNLKKELASFLLKGSNMAKFSALTKDLLKSNFNNEEKQAKVLEEYLNKEVFPSELESEKTLQALLLNNDSDEGEIINAIAVSMANYTLKGIKYEKKLKALFTQPVLQKMMREDPDFFSKLNRELIGLMDGPYPSSSKKNKQTALKVTSLIVKTAFETFYIEESFKDSSSEVKFAALANHFSKLNRPNYSSQIKDKMLKLSNLEPAKQVKSSPWPDELKAVQEILTTERSFLKAFEGPNGHLKALKILCQKGDGHKAPFIKALQRVAGKKGFQKGINNSTWKQGMNRKVFKQMLGRQSIDQDEAAVVMGIMGNYQADLELTVQSGNNFIEAMERGLAFLPDDKENYQKAMEIAFAICELHSAHVAQLARSSMKLSEYFVSLGIPTEEEKSLKDSLTDMGVQEEDKDKFEAAFKHLLYTNNGQTKEAILILANQRVPRYMLLFHEVVKNLKSSEEAFKSVTKSFHKAFQQRTTDYNKVVKGEERFGGRVGISSKFVTQVQ